MPKANKQLPVLVDGKITAQTAVIDFRGLKKDDQKSIWQAISDATGLRFKSKREDGRKIVLEFSWTNPQTILSFLREIVARYGYTPVLKSVN